MTEWKRVIECDIENFVLVVAVTKQEEVASKVISPAEGNIERDEKITGKSSSVEAHSSYALVGRPTSMRCHHHHSLPRLQPMRGETPW